MFLKYFILVSMSAAFFILLMEKTGIREYMQVYGRKVLSSLFSCDFCLSFWMCVLISLVVCFITGNFSFLVLAFVAAPVTRKML